MAQTTLPTFGAAEIFAQALRREIDAALAREPGLTRAELYSRMVPGSSSSSAAVTVRTYRAGGQWPEPGRIDQLAAGLGAPPSRLLAPPGLTGEHAEQLLAAIEGLLGTELDRSAEPDALIAAAVEAIASCVP